MLSHIQRIFGSTHFKREDEKRLARLLSLFLLAGLAFDLIALAVVGLFSSNPVPHIPLLLALLVVFLAPLVTLYFGYLRLATRMLIYPLWLMITLLVFASGGTSSINTAGLILVIFIAGMLAGKKDGLLVASLSVSTIVFILILEIIGLFPSPAITYPPIAQGAVSIIYLVFAALLLYLALNNLTDALKKIREREQENRIITEEALAGVYIIQEGRLVYANPTLQRITGYEVHELIGKPLMELIHPDDHDLVRTNVQRRMDDPSLRLTYTVRGLRKDGSTIYCEVMGRSAEYQGKQAIIGTLLDMTEYVKAEAAVRASEQLYRNLVEKVKDVIFTLSPDGTITSLNPAFEQITGWSPEEWLGASFAKLIHPRDLPLALKLLRSSLKDKSLRPFELQVMNKSGEVVYGEFLVTPQVQDGQLVGVLGIGREITDRKRAEIERDRLLQAEHEQRQLAETLAEVTLSLASKHNLTEVLDEILHQTRNIVPYRTANIVLLDGDKLNTVRWQGYEDYDSERFIANLKQNLTDYPVEQETVRTGLPIAIYDTHKDQRWRMMPETSWIRSFLVVPIRLQDTVLGLLRLDGDTPGEFTSEDGLRLSALANAAAIALDSARLQDEIENQALQLQQILDTVRDGIVLLDANQIIRLANPAACHYLKILAGVKVGQKLNHLGDVQLEDLLVPAEDGRPWHELSIPEGQRYFAITARALEREPQSGGWVMVLRDITEEHERQQYIVTQERLATVGQMAAGIAHDFNNILAVIELYSQMMLYTSSLSAKNRERLDIINQQSQRAASLIRQILDFSRRSLMERKQMRVLPFLKELVKLLERALPESIIIQFIYDEGDPEINADPARLQQALMNLALNARDAMPEGGRLEVSLARLVLDPEEKPPLPDMVPGEWVVLTISDAGTGIQPEHIDHVFEPFFTTKPPGEGTGLGLAQVYGIVRQHDGYIDVTSEVGVGTTFNIYLPALEQLQLQPELDQSTPTGGAGETILVVEDEAVTREAISEVLEILGYQVFIAGDGQEAQRLCSEMDGQLDLVLSDLIMPGMGGEELHSWLVENKPAVKMIAITGYPLKEGGKELLEKGIVAWIQKPFTADELSQVVSKALAESKESPVNETAA